MVAFPTLSFRIAFATAPYAATPTYTEIGPASGLGPKGLGWVRKIATKRGRERLLASQSQFQAGTLSASLDNRDRRFDPTNTAGPYYPNVQSGKLMQVGATWSSVFYPIWTGYVDDFPQQWPGFSESNVPLTATDFFKYAAVARLLSAGYQQAVLGDTPAAYWRLGDVVGSTIALDSSGNGFNAIPNAGVTFGEAGAMSANPGTGALLADSSPGPAGEIDFAGAVISSGTGFSVECWINTVQPTPAQDLEILTLPTAGLTNEIQLFLLGPGSPSCPAFAGGGGFPCIGPVPVNDGKWHHLVGTTTWGTGATATVLYVDGVPVANTVAMYSSLPSFVAGSIGTNYQIVPPNADPMNIQEVAVYNHALSAAQVLNHYEKGSWPSEFTGQVVNRILDTIGFPSGQRSVDTGRTLCQEDVQDETQTKVLDQLQKLEQTEQAECFVDAAGNLTFQDRYHRFESPNANSLATLGDGGSAFPTEIPYTMGGVVLNFDWDELFNDIPVTRRNGNLQEATNQTSINEFNNRTVTGLSDLLMASDLDALSCAEWILSDTAFPQYRVGQLILDPLADQRLWPIVLGAEIGNVLTVNKHNIPGGGSPTPISLVCRLEGIEHAIDAPNSWKCTMHVSLMGTQTWLILDDPVMDALDAGNRIGW